MRIQIKTKIPIKDKGLKALYVMNHALKLCETDRMKIATLEFFADRLSLTLLPKPLT